MATGDHSDLFMIFKDSNGKLIDGESEADMTSADPISQILLTDFVPRKVFAIERFMLSADADDQSEADIRKELAKQNAGSPAGTKGATKPPPAMSAAEINKEVKDRLNRQKGPPVKEISFTRTVDKSSAAFMSNVAIGKGYKSAALIKRKATGGKSAEQVAVVGDVYLRIDFAYVLITDVDWEDDEEEVKEDCKFICRKIRIRYRPQLPDGSLGAVIPGEWEWTPPAQ